jgi:hypothetical protein
MWACELVINWSFYLIQVSINNQVVLYFGKPAVYEKNLELCCPVLFLVHPTLIKVSTGCISAWVWLPMEQQMNNISTVWKMVLGNTNQVQCRLAGHAGPLAGGWDEHGYQSPSLLVPRALERIAPLAESSQSWIWVTWVLYPPPPALRISQARGHRPKLPYFFWKVGVLTQWGLQVPGKIFPPVLNPIIQPNWSGYTCEILVWEQSRGF